jgi:phenylacetate-CoA ligase
LNTSPKIISNTFKAKELLAFQDQLLKSQWWSEDRLKKWQFSKLKTLIKHSIENIEFYKKVFEKLGFDHSNNLDQFTWNKIPILTRTKVRELGDQLFSKSYPESLGTFWISNSGGSTGMPVSIKKTELDKFLWESINLREELWHRDYFLGTMDFPDFRRRFLTSNL